MRLAAPIAVLALLASVAGPASAQGDRVHLLGRSNLYDGAGGSGYDYNDVFGYVEPGTGREIAILGTWNGTSFVETTNPFAPVELEFIARAPSLWSDMSVWQNYVYVVTEGGGGLQIIDVSDLSNIQLVTTYTAGFDTTHSCWIDVTAGHFYACGTDNGLVILDLANPTAPTVITTYTANYVHELTAQNGLAHFSEIFDGIYRLVDVSALPTLTTLDTVFTPSNFTHSSAVDETDTFVGVTDEVNNAKFSLYDISNRSNITLRSTFIENPSGIIHNVAFADGMVELSAYAEGYVALDVTDPDRPLRIGAYDNFTGATGGYVGAWGVHRQPSGAVYISNIEDGLWVFARATRIFHDALPDTLDDVGPYVVTATVEPCPHGGGVTGVELEFTTDDGATSTTVALAPTANPDEWSASIPGQPRGTTVEYFLRATDSLGTSIDPVVPDGRHVFGVGERRSWYAESFDGATDAGWTHGKSTGSDDWQRGVPARKNQDPYRTISPGNCFGTDLGNGSDGLYSHNSSSWLESPAVDLTDRHGTRLRFQRWLRVDDSALDVARVVVNGVEVWRNPTNGGSLKTLDPEWALLDLDVAALADDVAATRVRFELTTNPTVTFGGWNVDDVELYSISTCRDSESYGTGTPGSGAFVPTLATVGDPMIGGPPFQLDGANMLGGVNGLLIVGFARVQIPFKGIDILADLAPPALLLPFKASGPAGVPGAGTISLAGAIPDDPTFVGIEVDTQVITFDAGGPKGLAASAGLAFWICQ